jgi:hypothetical protein
MTWTAIDRANRVGLALLVVVLIAAVAPILAGTTSLPLMAIAAVSTVAAWRLSLAREVRGRLDEEGIGKELGTRTWQLSWAQVSSARLIRFLGTDQLLVAGELQTPWSVSDRLFQTVPAGEHALQLPAGSRDEVSRLLAAHGVLLG